MTYTMKIAGLTRELPVCRVNEDVQIAAFIMFSDVELTVACASELLKNVPEFDVILTGEAKGIPIAYECAKQSGKNYVVGRKEKKIYMTDTIEVEVRSITTGHPQKLLLSCEDVERLRGKKVLILDDVISTGDSLRALEALCEKSGGIIVGRAAVLAEGNAAKRNDLIFLEELPLL